MEGVLQAASPGWTDRDRKGEIEITVRLDSQSPLDLEKLSKAASIKTSQKKVTISDVVFRNRGVIVKTGETFRLEGLSVRVDLILPEEILSSLKANRVKATVIGIPTQKSTPDSKESKIIRRYLEVAVTEVVEDPSFDLSALTGSWSHHRERDEDGIQVWVRGGKLPPSRFRGNMVFGVKGWLKVRILHPADRHYFADGTYRAKGDTLHIRYITTHKGAVPVERRLKVVRLEGDELRIKPLAQGK